MGKSRLSLLRRIKIGLVVAAIFEAIKWLWGHVSQIHDLTLQVISTTVIGIVISAGSVFVMLDSLPTVWQLLTMALIFLVVYGVFFYGSIRWIANRRMDRVSEGFKEIILDNHGVQVSDEDARRLARLAVWGESREELRSRKYREKLEESVRFVRGSGKYDVQRRPPTTTPQDTDAGEPHSAE